MKLLLLVIGCCVAVAVSKPAEDACAAMRARLLPSLEPSARADAGALRACDADSDGAVDAAELVSCVQRAFGSTAYMDRAEIGERIHCFRSIMTDTDLGGEQRQMIDTQQVRQLASGSGSVSGLECGGQNQLAQILVAIADGQLQGAYDALINWYIGTIWQSTGLLNGLLNNVSFLLQSLLSGRSSESLVYVLTAFVRSANNALTAPVEDALISSLLAVSVGNLAAAKILIKARLDAEVLNPAIQAELQWIIDAFDSGSTEDAVTRVISLLAGCATSDTDSIYTQILPVYDQFSGNISYGEELFLDIYERSQNRQPPLSDEIMNSLDKIAEAYRDLGGREGILKIVIFLVTPCGYDFSFALFLVTILERYLARDEKDEEFVNLLQSLIEQIENQPIYEEAVRQLQAILNEVKNSNYDVVPEGIRNIVVTCVDKAEMT